MYDFIDDIVNYINSKGYNATIINRELAVVKFNDKSPTDKLLFVRILNENDIYFVWVVFNSYFATLPVGVQTLINTKYSKLASFIYYKSDTEFTGIVNFNQAKLDKMAADILAFDAETK